MADWLKLIPWNIIFFLIGAILTLFAIQYARNAWLKPVPAFAFSNGNVKFIEMGNGRYAVCLHLDIINISANPALFNKCAVNGITLPSDKEERVKVTTDDAGEKIISLNNFGNTGILPGTVLNPGVRKTINCRVFFNRRPSNKIKVKIYTPNRAEKTVIADIQELPKKLQPLVNNFAPHS